MKKMFFIGMVFWALVTVSTPVGAWLYVPDLGDTGWCTYTFSAGAEGFSGAAGFVVSNTIDNSAYSELLLDNLSQGGANINRGFESGNYSNFTLIGDSCGEVTDSVMAESGTLYAPTQGDCLSHQFALAPGSSTSMFLNAYGQVGTCGSILETAISLGPGESFSFDWAFLGRDFSPWNDFSLFYLKDSQGDLAFFDGLGQIGTPIPPVPIPSTLLLLGSGLAGLLGLGWRSGRR